MSSRIVRALPFEALVEYVTGRAFLVAEAFVEAVGAHNVATTRASPPAMLRVRIPIRLPFVRAKRRSHDGTMPHGMVLMCVVLLAERWLPNFGAWLTASLGTWHAYLSTTRGSRCCSRTTEPGGSLAA